MELNDYDVTIVGAGASGLMAALELSLAGKRVAVIEARGQFGGRAATLYNNKFEKPLEPGAEFIHGDLELTMLFLKKAGVNYFQIDGEFWQKANEQWHEQNDLVEDFNALNKKLKELKKDIPVQDFIDHYLTGDKFEEARFSLRSYVEGYYAADPKRASTFALRDELNESDEKQYRIEGGYSKLFDYIFNQCTQKGVHFFFGQPVQSIAWQKENVSVITASKSFQSQKLLITVSIGVVRSGVIEFHPNLQVHQQAAKQLGFGGVVKTILQFAEPFWKNREYTQKKDLSKMGFIFSTSQVPTWWTHYPEETSILTGWSAGPHAEKIKDLSATETVEKALESLSLIFDVNTIFLRQKLNAWHVANWVNDPFCLGGYSYEVVDGGEAKKQLLRPVENTIWFTGEGLYEGIDIGTVNAALEMGKNSAREIIVSFKS